MDLREGLRIVVIPESGDGARTLSLSPWRARFALWGLAASVALLLVFGTSWVLMAKKAGRVAGLEEEVSRLQTELGQVDQLIERLETIEREYGLIQDIFGAGIQFEEDLWLPRSSEGAQSTALRAAEDATGAPSLWPLTERGFITQNLLEDGGDHSGLDIAVAEGSYIRASGSGTVAESGLDPVYGRFLRIDHGETVETLYAHASALLVQVGDTVRAGDVIATSGSTGQSSAPHLHFEVIVAGVSVDPLTRVARP